MHVGLILLTGAPGSAKGTQGRVLKEKYGVEHIEFSAYLSHAQERNEELDAQIENQRSQGMLISDAICNGVFDTYIKNSILKAYDRKIPVVLDGYPRTSAQLQHLLSSLHGRQIAHVFLDGSREMLEDRLRKRFTQDGRGDDVAAVIARRFGEYERLTVPVISRLLQELYVRNLHLYQHPGTSKQRVAKRIRQFLAFPRPKNGKVEKTKNFVGPVPASVSV